MGYSRPLPLLAALIAVAASAADEVPPADEEFLEFLGTIGAEEGWADFLASDETLETEPPKKAAEEPRKDADDDDKASKVQRDE